MPKLTILQSFGPNAMAETTIEFATDKEMNDFIKRRDIEKRLVRGGMSREQAQKQAAEEVP